MYFAGASGMLFCEMIASKSSMPGQNSITMISSSALSKTSSSPTMCGFRSRRMISYSRRRRAIWNACRSRSGRRSITFAANDSPLDRFVTRYTVENAPRPSSSPVA